MYLSEMSVRRRDRAGGGGFPKILCRKSQNILSMAHLVKITILIVYVYQKPSSAYIINKILCHNELPQAQNYTCTLRCLA